jgi:hypothetical protein
MNMTKHAESRSNQRGITYDVLSIIGDLGRITYAPGGAMKIYFGHKEYDRAIHKIKNVMKLLERARGGTLIMAEDKLLTTYRR